MMKTKKTMIASRHLSKSILLEETGTPFVVRMVILFGAAVLLSFIVWALFIEIDEVTVAEGEIVPFERKVQSVQHFEGGVIKEILVDDGSLVKEGQILIRLDPVSADTQYNQSRVKMENLMAKAEVLDAFLRGRSLNFARIGVTNPEILHQHKSIYFQMKERQKTQKLIRDKQIEQLRAEVAELKNKEKILTTKKALLEEEMTIRDDLVKKQLNSKVLFLGMQRQLNDLTGELNELPIKVTKTEAKIVQTRKTSEENETNLLREQTTNLNDIMNEIAQEREAMKRGVQKKENLEIRSPAHGVVHGLKQHTIGGVIPPGATILEIVPDASNLVAEVKIKDRDVGHLKPGQKVKVKLVTYDFSRYGYIPGKLKYISPTSVKENTALYYRGIVTLDKIYLGNDPKKNNIIAGMTVNADIKTGSKTIMQYLLRPLYSSVKGALIER